MMKHTLLLLGASALAFTSPALAKPGRGKGPGAQGFHSEHLGVRHTKGDHGKHYAYARNCPPGLAKQNAMCMPPGQFKKLYGIGQRFPTSYGSLWSYNQIPLELRSRYGFDPASRYYYGDGYLYRVDPRTMLIREVVNAILR